MSVWWLAASASPDRSPVSSGFRLTRINTSRRNQANEQMSLRQLRELATRQQEHIEATQRLIMAREHKLKCLKHEELIKSNQMLSEQQEQFARLRESVTAQEIKLRQLRALKGQVLKQRCSNSNHCKSITLTNSILLPILITLPIHRHSCQSLSQILILSRIPLLPTCLHPFSFISALIAMRISLLLFDKHTFPELASRFEKLMVAVEVRRQQKGDKTKRNRRN